MTQLLRAASVATCVALAAACGSDSGPVTPHDPPPDTGFAFTYVPPVGAPNVVSVTVPGSFNAWNNTAAVMKKQDDGSWLVHVPNLPNGRYQYKFYINGAWPTDMCSDRTWGDPAKNFWIDPDALGCTDDGNSGENAVIDVGPAPTDLGFQHDPSNSAYVSAAGGQLSVRFRASQGIAQSAAVKVGATSYPMHLQLNYQLMDEWRAQVPLGTTSYTISVTTAAGTQEKGPFTVPGTVFTAVPWVGSAVGYQIFPERFWNGDTTNDHFGPETDEYGFLDPAFRGSPPTRATSWSAAINSQGCCTSTSAATCRASSTSSTTCNR